VKSVKHLLPVAGLLLVLCAAIPAYVVAACPTICVIIPEHVIIRLRPTPVPDPAAETAIIHAFLDYGLHVVDQAQVQWIRYGEDDWAARAATGEAAAIAYLSERFAADILVVGEAFAEEDEQVGELVMQAARARVELRAIETSTGRILAAEALHTGGVDLTMDAAAKRALQRAGERVAPLLGGALARHIPPNCISEGRVIAEPDRIGVTAFENLSRMRSSTATDLITTMLETELSERGCRTAHAMAVDIAVTGSITEWEEVMTAAIAIPLLNVLFRTGVVWMTLDVQVFNMVTGDFQAYEVTQRATGIEILGIRLGMSSRSLIRKVCEAIADRICWHCRG
jgi:hypothetical protein